MILFILQNAYTSVKYHFTNYEEWSEALGRSYSGKRLSEMIPEKEEFRVINASPNIGNFPDSCFAPNLSHIEKWLIELKPKVVVACGKVAQEGCEKLGVAHIKAPHPAWRQLSKKQTEAIKKEIKSKL